MTNNSALARINPRSLRMRDERGQATAEYGVVILVAVALGMAVLMLFTNGIFDGVLGDLVKHVLKSAIGRVG